MALCAKVRQTSNFRLPSRGMRTVDGNVVSVTHPRVVGELCDVVVGVRDREQIVFSVVGVVRVVRRIGQPIGIVRKKGERPVRPRVFFA